MHTFTVNARIYSVNGCIYSVNVRTYKNLFSGSGLSPSKVFHYERPISWITFLSHCDFGNLKKKPQMEANLGISLELLLYSHPLKGHSSFITKMCYNFMFIL